MALEAESRQVNVRLRRLPLWPLMAAGAVSGFVGGLFAGCVLGAIAAWFAGAVLDWHRQLGFTLGVTEELLPLGEQVGVLQTMRDLWFLVIPGMGLLFGVLNGLVGFLTGGLMGGLFNRFAREIDLDVDMDER
ncbi:MAG TPA: hypothetical protein VKF14_01730 [Candidatus Dormibacteraeota bacterium]|nr:hypothetical protein [Candidatus Dormibacteraeota bacterium]